MKAAFGPIHYSAERDHYYDNRLKAQVDPQKYLSIIIDGMDQAKTNILYVTSVSNVLKFLSNHNVTHFNVRWM